MNNPGEGCCKSVDGNKHARLTLLPTAPLPGYSFELVREFF